MLNKKQINNVITLLKINEVVVLPTDTIYGLSAIVAKENMQKINNLKKAPKNKELIILFSKLKQLKSLKIEIQNKKILKKNRNITFIFSSSDKKTHAIRMVERKDLKKIIRKVGPIFSTSVNFHNQESINNKKDLFNFNTNIKVFYDNFPIDTNPSKIYNTITKEWIR